MKIQAELTNQAVLEELGKRLAGVRIELGLTQAALGERSGVAKRTIERLESGTAATQLSGLLSVCRALGLLERFEALLPEPVPGPMAQLRQQGHKRQRARASKAAPSRTKTWTWGEPE